MFFSSHLLDEVERVSDELAMIVQGRVVFCGRLDDIKQAHRRWIVRFASALLQKPRFPGLLHAIGAGKEWTLWVNGGSGQVASRQALAPLGGIVIEETVPSLDEIFVARARATAA